MNCYINADVSLSDEGSSNISMVFLSTNRNIIRHNLPLDFNQDFNLKSGQLKICLIVKVLFLNG